jgi:hypothetical protein
MREKVMSLYLTVACVMLFSPVNRADAQATDHGKIGISVVVQNPEYDIILPFQNQRFDIIIPFWAENSFYCRNSA